MKAQRTMTRRKSFLCRLFLLLALAIFSSAPLVCAQTSKNPEKTITPDSFNTLMSAVKQQQEQIRRQQKEIDSLKLNSLGDGGNVAGAIVGSGTPVKRIISITKSIVFNNPNDDWVNVSVPGAQPTDLVLIGVSDQGLWKRVFTGAVDKADNVRVRIYTSIPVPKIPTPPILVRIVVIGF